jgi:hypothetical protein
MDCTLCHSYPQRGPLTPIGTTAPATQAQEGWHLLELKGKHQKLLCHQCHTVGVRPSAECAACHRLSRHAPMMSSMSCSECHEKAGEAKPVADCGGCHGDLGGLHRQKPHQGAKCGACHKPHVWTVVGRELCLTCHADKKSHNLEGGGCTSCHDFKPEPKTSKSKAKK